MGQSKTQIMNNVTPISQYAGSPSFNANLNSNGEYRYIVKKGDTLNEIIKATFNQHPLKMKLIRKAIIEITKKYFPQENQRPCKQELPLIIPSFGIKLLA